jgi:hypothetical protein
MDKIIQLSEREYNKLNEQASYNQNQIETLALEMYQKRGTYEIELNIDIEKDYYDKLKFKIYTSVVDYGNYDYEKRYELPYEQKKEICDYVNRKTDKLMTRKFGKQIRDINFYNARVAAIRIWKYKFIGLSIFGWLAALALVII